MGENKGERLLIGFALETDDIVENAEKKLTGKNLDMVSRKQHRRFSE